jgi:hypothetical protein
MASALIRVNEVLDAFSRDARKTADARSAALKKETELLENTLMRLFSNVIYSDLLYLENDELILIDQTQEIPMENRGIEVINQLFISLDKVTLTHRVKVVQWNEKAKTNYKFVDEQDISCQEAIEVFGLEAICESLADQLKSQPSPQAQVSEYQERIDRADRLLAAAQEAIGQDGLVEIKEQSQ